MLGMAGGYTVHRAVHSLYVGFGVVVILMTGCLIATSAVVGYSHITDGAAPSEDNRTLVLFAMLVRFHQFRSIFLVSECINSLVWEGGRDQMSHIEVVFQCCGWLLPFTAA